MNNFKLFLEAVSPFFELKGFRFIKSKNGFYKSNNDGNIEFIKFSSHKDISVEPVFGISIPKFDKIFTSSSIKSFQTEGTLFCKNDWIKYYYPTDDFVLQHTLLNTQKLYNECILLFHEKNNSLKGILQTLHLGGYDDEFLKIGRKFKIIV